MSYDPDYTPPKKAPQKAAPKACECWQETDAKLAEKGFKLSDSLSFLQWTQSGPMKVTRTLPLSRLDGLKLKRSDPKCLTMTHCPFCGVKYNN